MDVYQASLYLDDYELPLNRQPVVFELDPTNIGMLTSKNAVEFSAKTVGRFNKLALFASPTSMAPIVVASVLPPRPDINPITTVTFEPNDITLENRRMNSKPTIAERTT